jgi:hypothetical protein
VRSNAPHLVDELIRRFGKRYGAAKSFGKSRLYQFGDTLACSINYSKELGGNKYFFGLAQEVVDSQFEYPTTKAGPFVVLICGSADKVLMLPRECMRRCKATSTFGITARTPIQPTSGALSLGRMKTILRLIFSIMTARLCRLAGSRRKLTSTGTWKQRLAETDSLSQSAVDISRVFGQ